MRIKENINFRQIKKNYYLSTKTKEKIQKPIP
jgi:hypothetical protein